ncbi:MAG TPA: glycosyltransferase family 4 protein [Polyangiales bacterium]
MVPSVACMRVLLLNQFYPPDVAPTGHYLHDLGRALVAAGHQVTVVASRHAYAGGGEYAAHEWLEGVEVVRLSGFGFGRSSYVGKLADYLGYYTRLAAKLAFSHKPDLIVALTTPPFVGLLAMLAARARGARHAHWVMDVYPDVMKAHGMLDGAAYAALQQLARLAFTRASLVVTLGPAMAETLRPYVRAGTQLQWVPLWAPAALKPWPAGEPVPLRAERGWAADQTVLLYSGNMGLGHRFEEFLSAAERLGPRGPRWVFAGTGRSRPTIERFVEAHPELPVQLMSYVPEETLRQHLCSADVHLVSLDARWEGTLLPSKLQASFALGKPVIFVGAPSQDMARWIEQSGGGWVVGEGDVAGLLAAVEQAKDPLERAKRGQLALQYSQHELAKATNVQRLVQLLAADN